MAFYNEILVGRFNRALQKITGIKSTAPVRQLAGEFMATVRAEQFDSAENRYLMQVDRFGGQFDSGATTQANIRLRSPAGGNMIATLEKILVSAVPAASVPIFVRYSQTGTATDLAGAFGSVRLDNRTQRSPMLVVTTATTGFSSAGFTNIIQTQSAGNGIPDELIRTVNQELMIAPGTVVQIDNAGTAQETIISIIWRERFLEESERA